MIEACFWKQKGPEQTKWTLISLKVCMPLRAVAELVCSCFGKFGSSLSVGKIGSFLWLVLKACFSRFRQFLFVLFLSD